VAAVSDPKSPVVLIVEDERSIADNLTYALGTEGFVTHWRSLGQDGLALLRERAVDLVVLDVGLPDASGLELCKQIRSFSEVPIVFLTARKEEVDRIVGLEIGADDYVTKPFSPREMVARIKAILKRARGGSVIRPARIVLGPLAVDAERARVTFGEVALDLTRYEFLLLRFLAGSPERVFSRDELLDQVWGTSQTTLARTVDAHVKSLRAKLRAAGAADELIRTHRGLGYSLSVERR
jgi:two-component system catabolic regulation response regulator CreB